MQENSIVAWAPAKINLALAVTAKRADGYHSLETVFQSISLADRVKVTVNNKTGITCSCGDLSGEKNLAYKAAQVFWELYQQLDLNKMTVGIEIAIEKNIPYQAGLAGGSSDAAAVLRALNTLFASPFSWEDLLGLAKQCGSDTAFCLQGGTQWGEGTGTSLSKLPSLPEVDILLVKPSKGISTAEAYRVFDELREYSSLNKNLWNILLREQDKQKIAGKLANSLEKAAMILLPEIAQVKKLLLQGGCLGAVMSGSGSAVFGIPEDREQGQKLAQQLINHGYINTWLVRTIN